MTDIFICAHKDFSPQPTSKDYKIIRGITPINTKLEQFADISELTPLEYTYAEGSRMYWVWKNYPLKDYVGFCQYRKYFMPYFYNTDTIEADMKDCDAILPQPMSLSTNIEIQYDKAHNLEDLYLALQLVRKTDYADYADKLLKQDYLYPYNMFIMSRSNFNAYCEFIFPILKEFCALRHWVQDSDVAAYVEANKYKYFKEWQPLKYRTAAYNSRIVGFLLERLSNIFYEATFKDPLIVPVKIIGKTVDYKKTGD